MVDDGEKPQINDLIFKELIKRGYSLEGNTRVWNIADSKLWYLTPDQAQAYLDLENNEEYKEGTGQPQAHDLMVSNINELLDLIKDEPINLIDLGCGDGIKAANIVREIKKLSPKHKIRYCPVDISGYMVEKAIDTFKNLDVDEIIEFRYNISDFENLENISPLLTIGEYEKSVFLLLGNTLGNFEANELLYEIRSAMGFDDVFIVDTAIDDKKQEERIKAYNKNKKIDDFLKHIPVQLGLNEKEVSYGTRWKHQRVEFYYTIKKTKKINFQDKEINFYKGDQIIVAISYKHNKEDLITFLHSHFGKVDVINSEDNSKALAICKK